MTTVTNTCNGWVGCPQNCTPGTVSITNNITQVIPNTSILSSPGLNTATTIGDNSSGVRFGVAMLPCTGADCYTDDTATAALPDTCANGCTGVAATGCVSCLCKMNGGSILNANAALPGADADYYNIPEGSTSIYEFPATINWYTGGSIPSSDVYTTLNLPTPLPAGVDVIWAGKTDSWFVESNYILAIARVDINNKTTDTQGRTLYAPLSTENVRFGSQVAILCYNENISRWTYLALSSLGGYQQGGTVTADVFDYDKWSNSWTVWRSLPQNTSSTLSQTHPFYGDGVWNIWDPNGATITNLLFQSGRFYLQNWLISTTSPASATWEDAYDIIPNNIVDVAIRAGYMGSYNTALVAGGLDAYNTFVTDNLLISNTSCMPVQKINPFYTGNPGAAPPIGSNEQYFGMPLMGVSQTLSQLANNPEGLTDQTTCEVGGDDLATPVSPSCNCTSTQQFYIWYINAFGGCLVEEEIECLPQSDNIQPVPSSVPTWVPWVVGILAIIIMVLIGLVIWYGVKDSKGDAGDSYELV